MEKTLLLAAMSALMVYTTAHADNLSMPQTAEEAVPSASTSIPAAAPTLINLPRKGAGMAQVAKEFGEPQVKHPAVGGGQPRQPPITRWDYAGFSVFFENTHVVDAVRPDQPAEIHRKEELKAAP
ncbi:MAG: hypothetical protein V4607_03500 [Pseudomonadota bacterium]